VHWQLSGFSEKVNISLVAFAGIVSDEKKSLCFMCLYRDVRPEVGSGDKLIYCIKKERVVSPKTACELFVRSTDKNREQMKTAMYGTFSEEEEG
jgi:hypothetical protein